MKLQQRGEDVLNHVIQEERAEVALYIFLNNSNANFDMSEVLSNNNRWMYVM